MSQRIREVERDRKFEEYANREGDIVTGIIQQTDTRYTLLDLGRVEALLPQAEQVPFERPQPGDRLQGLHRRGPQDRQGPADRRQPHPSRPDQAPVRARGARDRRRHRRDQGLRPRARAPHEDRRVVERPQRRPGRRLRRRPRRPRAHGRQRAARREDRHRPVQRGPRRLRRQGAVAGQGQRRSIVSDDGTQADVIVPDHQLSLAIGREGQNARLAARLTGVRVDIRSETQLAEGVPAARRARRRASSTPRASGSPNAETGEMEWHAADGTRDQRGRVERRSAGGRAASAGGRGRAPRRAPRRRPSEPPSRPRTTPATRPTPATTPSRRRGRRADASEPRPTSRRASRRRRAGRRVTRPVPSAPASGAARRRPQAELVRCVLAADGRAVVEPHGAGPWRVAVRSDRVTASSSPCAARRSSGRGDRPVGRTPLDELGALDARAGRRQSAVRDVMTRKVE